MLLLNHIFSRICCPMKITCMCVQPGWQPTWCPEPRFSVSSQGTPGDQDRVARGWRQGLSLGKQGSCIEAPLRRPVGSSVGPVTSWAAFCRTSIPWTALEDASMEKVWRGVLVSSIPFLVICHAHGRIDCLVFTSDELGSSTILFLYGVKSQSQLVSSLLVQRFDDVSVHSRRTPREQVLSVLWWILGLHTDPAM